MPTQVLVAAAAAAAVATGSTGSAAAGFLGSRRDLQVRGGGFAGFNGSSRTQLERRRRRLSAAAVLVRNPPAGTADRAGNSENGRSRSGAGGSNGAGIGDRGSGNGAAVVPVVVVVNEGPVNGRIATRASGVPVKKLTGINADTPKEREAEARAALRAADAVAYDPVALNERYSRLPFKVSCPPSS